MATFPSLGFINQLNFACDGTVPVALLHRTPHRGTVGGTRSVRDDVVRNFSFGIIRFFGEDDVPAAGAKISVKAAILIGLN